MGIFCPVIQAFVRSMFDAWHDVALCCAIGSQFIGDHDARRNALGRQKLSHQTFGSLGVAAALHQHVENEAILINRSPQPVLLCANGDDDLIEMLFVPQAFRLIAAGFHWQSAARISPPKAALFGAKR